MIASVSAIFLMGPEVLNDIGCSYELVIRDGQLYIEGSKEDISSKIPIKIDKKRKYDITMGGNATGEVPSDFILAMVLYDEQENEVAYATGDMFQALMMPMELEVGDHFLEMYHLVNENSWDKFVDAYDERQILARGE